MQRVVRIRMELVYARIGAIAMVPSCFSTRSYGRTRFFHKTIKNVFVVLLSVNFEVVARHKTVFLTTS